MSRRPRVFFEGAIYHACFRGNARQPIFVSDADRERFLESLSERVEEYDVRLYLYCLMVNHVHLLVETPMANLPDFMGSLLTSYATYFNLCHNRVGHLTQGRYKSPLVEGNDYLLRLSRYIHLNPVFVGGWKRRALEERIAHLRDYPWSSYPAYAGLAKPQDFVDYGPFLALVGSGDSCPTAAYRKYVEAGLAESDEEFVALLQRSELGVGSDGFVEDLKVKYSSLAGKRVKREDVSFRQAKRRVAPAAILEGVCEFYGIGKDELRAHPKNDRIRPVAAALLTRLGGLTQREAAGYLGLKTGAAVCLQLKRLRAGQDSQAAQDWVSLRRKFNI